MNIALPSILLLILILPGSLFRYAYRRGTWKSPVIFDTVLSELSAGIVYSLLVHVAFYALFDAFGMAYDIASVLAVVAGYYTADGFSSTVDVVARQLPNILVYFVALNVTAATTGLLLHWLVRSLHLDLKIALLRFNNQWFYAFSGEARIIEELEKKPWGERVAVSRASIQQVLESLYVYASAVVTHGPSSYLYWGIVTDYYFAKDGRLDRIVLIQARRRSLADDRADDESAEHETEDGRFYDIYGDQLILDYAKINTLNLDYRYISAAEEPPEQHNKSLE